MTEYEPLIHMCAIIGAGFVVWHLLTLLIDIAIKVEDWWHGSGRPRDTQG